MTKQTRLAEVEDHSTIYQDGMDHAQNGYNRRSCPWDGGLRKQIWLSGYDTYVLVNTQNDPVDEDSD